MIVCAAIQVSGFRKDLNKLDKVNICGVRHGDCLKIIELFKGNWEKIKCKEGFMTSDGEFLDRKEAYNYVFKNGLISETTALFKANQEEDELYSEDLY